MSGLAAALAACGTTLTAPPPVSGGDKKLPDTSAAVGNKPFDLAQVDLPKLREQALGGSGATAYRLAQYYGFAAFDHEEELYWMAVAAENGDVRAAYGFGLLLSKRISERDKARARYWLMRAKASGEEPVSGLAANLLTEMGDGTSK